jgi:hypothetical protein
MRAGYRKGATSGLAKPFNDRTRRRAKAAAGLRDRILRQARVDERIERSLRKEQ